ncbi:3-oxoacyl-reductase [Piptocephalis cylindrospora]|uniref:3-oxoacyl-reductase n=1 Tax=Piptocephalis cylindrospora TaxID=1907219 RepID=A0A4P9XZ72_9FUNG|nr:3-oxoacyl-reductase [Piptocephalis cylindrospora]|eukprot:RKP11664.1 3-oxoacyl-reductase [Piptocephalis cylindrospora]
MTLPVALVTGGTRGIGAAVVKALLPTHRVCFTGRDVTKVQEQQEAHLGTGHETLGVVCNVRETDQVTRLVEEVKAYGALDLVVHCAGITRNALLLRSNDQLVQEVMDTNLHGSIRVTRGILPLLLRQRKGSIIHVASVAGPFMGQSGLSIYGASKAGLIGLTTCLAKEVGRSGVRVNCLCPGYIHTDMTLDMSPDMVRDLTSRIPLGRFGEAQEVAQAVLYLHQAQYMTGQTLVLDGGLST